MKMSYTFLCIPQTRVAARFAVTRTGCSVPWAGPDASHHLPEPRSRQSGAKPRAVNSGPLFRKLHKHFCTTLGSLRLSKRRVPLIASPISLVVQECAGGIATSRTGYAVNSFSLLPPPSSLRSFSIALLALITKRLNCVPRGFTIALGLTGLCALPRLTHSNASSCCSHAWAFWLSLHQRPINRLL